MPWHSTRCRWVCSPTQVLVWQSRNWLDDVLSPADTAGVISDRAVLTGVALSRLAHEEPAIEREIEGGPILRWTS